MRARGRASVVVTGAISCHESLYTSVIAFYRSKQGRVSDDIWPIPAELRVEGEIRGKHLFFYFILLLGING